MLVIGLLGYHRVTSWTATARVLSAPPIFVLLSMVYDSGLAEKHDEENENEVAARNEKTSVGAEYARPC